MQQHTATTAASATLSCTGLLHQVPSQSIRLLMQTVSSVDDMFKVVVMIFQQIMTELNGAESEEDRIIALTKIY
jgi:hypothetical protein